MRLIVDVCYLIAAVAVAPILAYRAMTTGKYRRGWKERFGYVPDLPECSARIWIHAVSVGEVNAARTLVAALQERHPEADIVISTTTDTGYARARTVFPHSTVFRYPLDFSWVVKRALRRIHPRLVVLIELEVWYQFVTHAARQHIPIAVVNGRLSERSVRRFGRVRRLIRPMFEALSWVGVQDETYGERFRTLGTASSAVSVTGSVKWDTADVTDHVPGADDFARATGLDVTRPIWVCGSTGPGEEPVILDAYRQIRQDHADLQLVIVPRKPERFDEVAGHMERAGYTCTRRSRHGDSTGPATNASADSVVLGDTMGELRKIYTLADVVFVGRSLADMGGSDMMEVAALAKPVVVGPHTENFADTMKRLRAGDAIREIDRDLDDDQAAHYLAQAVGELLSDRSLAERLAANGRRVVQKNRGATQRTVAALLELLDRAQHAAS